MTASWWTQRKAQAHGLWESSRRQGTRNLCLPGIPNQKAAAGPYPTLRPYRCAYTRLPMTRNSAPRLVTDPRLALRRVSSNIILYSSALVGLPVLG